jgi:polar amino acid transport system substrate-binding protein
MGVLALAACSTKPADTLARARKEGSMRLGFANEAPFAFRDPNTGALLGEAPSVAHAVLTELGVPETVAVLTEFGSLIPGLRAGRFDVIAAGMYITKERCKQVLFSEPSYCVREALLVHKGNPLGLHSYEDLAQSSATLLAVVAGTVEVSYAQRTGVPSERIQVFPDPPSALEGLLAGRVHAYAATSLTINDLLRKRPDAPLTAAAPFAPPSADGKPVQGCGAFAFRPEDRALRDAFDLKLKRLLGTPEHASLVSPFGFDQTTSVAGSTRDVLCGAPN